MILSGPEILRQLHIGNISIDPFDASCLGPNSYDVHLSSRIIELDNLRIKPWDIKESIPEDSIRYWDIPEHGFVLQRGIAYLGCLMEHIHCAGFVPWLDGRSTIGRYFLQIHQTAGRGDDGFGPAQFTCELMAMAHSLRVYSGAPIAQLSFFRLDGERKPYRGRYQYQTGPTLPKPLRW